jgi:hypothetical protein
MEKRKNKICTFRYPEKIKEPFLANGGLTLSNGRTVSAEEMWWFLTVEAPCRFPADFTYDRFSAKPFDFNLLTAIKWHYWGFTGIDRFRNRIKRGDPIVTIKAGTPGEIFSASECMTTGPAFPIGWITQDEEGFSREEDDRRYAALRNECKKCMPAECCTIVAPFNAVHVSKAPIKLLAPFTVTACSDGIYAMETARRHGDNIPTYVVDFPISRQSGPWRVE